MSVDKTKATEETEMTEEEEAKAITKLKKRIKGKVKTPMTFQQIECAVGKQTGFLLGRVLTQMVIDKQINHRESRPYSKCFPVYSVTPFPLGFEMTERESSAKNLREVAA